MKYTLITNKKYDKVPDVIEDYIFSLNIISEIDNERFIKIDYDELTKNPSKILNSIFNKIDVHIDKISNIGVNPNLDTFYGNSSDNKEIFLQ